MGDASVAEAIRSSARFVVVESPGGGGKTYQGASYARDIAPSLGDGRLLILTHTNAACDVFAARTRGLNRRVEIRTIDGLITEIACAYHKALGLPADVGAWARREGGNGYSTAAQKVAKRSEEHTSELQSLMRISYAVFCLKKKTLSTKK